MSLFFKLKPLNSTERFQHSLRMISDEAKGILESLGKDSQDYTGQVKQRLVGIADYAGETSHEIERQLRLKANELDNVVHNRPYEFLGVAAGIGLLFGLLLSNRRR